MTTFPPLIPSSRVFTPGGAPYTPYRSGVGTGPRSNHGALIVGQTLELQFIGLNESALGLMRAHWQAVRGRTYLFQLPAEVWNGEEGPGAFTPPGYAWRYDSPPTADEDPTNTPDGGDQILFDVSVTLAMEPSLDPGIIIPSVRVVLQTIAPTVTG
jgi:hypothetical protein